MIIKNPLLERTSSKAWQGRRPLSQGVQLMLPMASNNDEQRRENQMFSMGPEGEGRVLFIRLFMDSALIDFLIMSDSQPPFFRETSYCGALQRPELDCPRGQETTGDVRASNYCAVCCSASVQLFKQQRKKYTFLLTYPRCASRIEGMVFRFCLSPCCFFNS